MPLQSDQQHQLVRNIDVEIKLKKIFQLIHEESFSKAKKQISLLEKELNGEIPELLSAKIEIELSE